MIIKSLLLLKVALENPFSPWHILRGMNIVHTSPVDKRKRI